MALRDQPYLPLYVQDYLTDEKLNECSAATQGVYIKLMCLMHKSKVYGTILLKQKPKQGDSISFLFAEQVGRHLPFTESILRKAIGELLVEEVLKYDKETNSLIQKRMVKDHELSEKRAKSGKKGGKSTQKSNKKLAKAKVKASSQASSEYENEDEFVNENKDVIELEVRPTFEEFWNLYDKKTGKAECIGLWKKLPQKDRESIMEYLPDYIRSTPDPQYRKNPKTFLNKKNRHWEDHILPAIASNSGISRTLLDSNR